MYTPELFLEIMVASELSENIDLYLDSDQILSLPLSQVLF